MPVPILLCGKRLLDSNFLQHGGGGRKTQPSQLFAARQRRCTSHLVAQRSSKPRDLCYRMCTSFLPPKNIKVRGTKHQCKPPSFLTGELSSTAKSSLPEGLCGWRLLENLTHWEVGHVQKNIRFSLGCSWKQPKSGTSCYTSKPKTESGEEPTGLDSKLELTEVATTVQVLICCSIKQSACVQLLTQTIAPFFFSPETAWVIQTFKLFLSVFLGNVHSFE